MVNVDHAEAAGKLINAIEILIVLDS